MKYNHLDAPYEFKEFYTKYPQGYTIYEALLEWLTQVNEMIDLVNVWDDTLNAFVLTFPTNLQAEVIAVLTDWQTTGFLNIVINEALQTEIDEVKESLPISLLDFSHLVVADDWTIALQTAINSLPLNTLDTGVLSPKGFANGGKIVIPAGRYKISDTILLQRGIIICGEGRESTQLVSFTTGSVFKYLDSGRYIQDELVFRDLSIWQDPTVIALSGAGIEVSFGAVTVQSTNVIIDNMIIEGTYKGLSLSALVWSTISNVFVSKCVNRGIELIFTSVDPLKSTSSTSTSFINCYVNQCGGSGYYIERGAYCGFVGCASDSNAGYGYELVSGLSHNIQNCGSEQNILGAVHLKQTEGVTVNIHVVYTVASGNAPAILCDTNKQVLLVGGRYNGTTISEYAIKTVGVNEHITVIGTEFEGSYETRVCSSVYKFLHLTSDYGLVGTGHHWGLGVTQQPDTSALLHLGGTGDVTTSTGLLVNRAFIKPFTRNVSAYVQAIISAVVETFGLVIGLFIPNASVGAGATVQKSAGVYIVDQTQGTDANANLMIDGGEGSVPAGQWNIYSGSTKNNYYKGSSEYALGKGVIVRTPDNTKSYRLGVDNSGNITTTLI